MTGFFPAPKFSMRMIPKELFAHIIVPSLRHIGYGCERSALLLLGIATVESNCGQYFKQRNGPACGIYQIEPATEQDVLRYVQSKPQLKQKIISLTTVPELDLTCNLAYQTAIARCKLLMISEPLPDAKDVWAMAKYWKQYYNTPLGKGRVEDFVNKYPKDLLCNMI